MKFGKLQDISTVDFSLPPDAPGTAEILNKNAGKASSLRFYLGCTGWSMPEWVGKVYPAKAKSKEFLKYYTQQFNTIELNTTHYRIPTIATIVKWKAESAPDFKFCPKIPQVISHSRNLGLGEENIMAFCDAVQRLEEKLGCCFMQLPPYFGLERIELLEKFIRAFPTHIPLAIEFRHESWFEKPENTQRALRALERHRISTVLTDVAGRRDVLHMRLTTPTAMVRFVGNGLHDTDYTRIDEWVGRIEAWQRQGLSEIYFFTHEPDNILAPEMSAYLWEQIKGKTNIISRGPSLIDDQRSRQMSLF